MIYQSRKRTQRFFAALAETIHQVAVDHGWHGTSLSTDLAMLHDNRPFTERANTVILILDYAQGHGWDISETLWSTVQVNGQRAHRHGGKRF
jgi:hypothetical protein